MSVLFNLLRIPVLMAAASAILLLGCEKMALTPDLPKIKAINPPSNEEVDWQSFREGITVAFTQPMEVGTINPNTFIVRVKYPDVIRTDSGKVKGIYTILTIAGKIIYSEENHSATFFPDNAFLDSFSSVLGSSGKAWCTVMLKGDFIRSKQGLPLDGDHMNIDSSTGEPKAGLPSGDWLPGGDFESWFIISR